MAAQPEPFTLRIPDEAIGDLRDRLARTRFPDQTPGDPWAYGTDVGYLRHLVEYWHGNFDWRAEEARLNAFPQHKARLCGIDLHFLHVPAKGPAPCPLLLLHGWPGSVFEFLELIPRLTDPARFGGNPEDAFTVVAPSLPGYGLSFKPGQPRFGIEEIADCVAELMHDTLGYTRFAAQGGDWGASIASPLGYAHPERMIGIHLTLCVAALSRADGGAGADSGGAAHRRSGGVRSVPGRRHPPAPLAGGTDLQRHPAVERHAARRPFRRAGAAGGARQRGARILPAAAGYAGANSKPSCSTPRQRSRLRP